MEDSDKKKKGTSSEAKRNSMRNESWGKRQQRHDLAAL